MNNIRQFTLTMILCLIMSQTWAQKLHSLLNDRMFETSQVAIMVWDLDADTLCFAHNSHQLMRPASTMKLITAITALDLLGSDYQYTTTVLTDGGINGNVLNGNLYVKGGMDPGFEREHLDAISQGLASLGISRISGDIILDRSFKDALMLGEGWCWDDDNPILSPLLCNRKDYLDFELSESLRRNGITTSGVSREGYVPESATALIRHTNPLDNVLLKMMKSSDNLYAESMFYQIGAQSGGTSTAKAAQQTEQLLVKQLGLDPADYRFADGSGLSLYDYVTAELHIRLLRHAYNNKRIFNTLYPSLPIAGVDGTLKNRMKGTKAAQNVHAKTGTVTGVSALAGYLTASTGNTLAFCIINQGILSSKEGRDFQDRVCTILCK